MTFNLFVGAFTVQSLVYLQYYAVPQQFNRFAQHYKSKNSFIDADPIITRSATDSTEVCEIVKLIIANLGVPAAYLFLN